MTFAIPATVYNKKYNFIFIFFPTYLPNFSKKKSVNQLIKLEWPKRTSKLSCDDHLNYIGEPYYSITVLSIFLLRKLMLRIKIKLELFSYLTFITCFIFIALFELKIC